MSAFPDKNTNAFKIKVNKKVNKIQASLNDVTKVTNKNIAEKFNSTIDHNYDRDQQTISFHDQMSTAIAPRTLEESSLHLVPCRWSLSGWKYVKVDPQNQKYFNNPHRFNGQGIYTGHQSPNSQKKMMNILGVDNGNYDQRMWMGDVVNEDVIETTYSKFFSPTK